MGEITFLVGGTRSGKSSLAVEIGRRHDGPVVFVAGFSRDKEHESILSTLGRAASRFVLTRYHGERATPPDPERSS